MKNIILVSLAVCTLSFGAKASDASINKENQTQIDKTVKELFQNAFQDFKSGRIKIFQGETRVQTEGSNYYSVARVVEGEESFEVIGFPVKNGGEGLQGPMLISDVGQVSCDEGGCEDWYYIDYGSNRSPLKLKINLVDRNSGNTNLQTNYEVGGASIDYISSQTTVLDKGWLLCSDGGCSSLKFDYLQLQQTTLKIGNGSPYGLFSFSFDLYPLKKAEIKALDYLAANVTTKFYTPAVDFTGRLFTSDESYLNFNDSFTFITNEDCTDNDGSTHKFAVRVALLWKIAKLNTLNFSELNVTDVKKYCRD